MDAISLGEATATWAIKDFSVVLRQQITQAARRQDCTVADWLHGYFQTHGIDGQTFAPVNLAPVEPSPALAAPPVSTAASELASLVASAEALGRTRRMPREIRQLLNAALIDRAQRLAPVPANAPKRLAAPSTTVKLDGLTGGT